MAIIVHKYGGTSMGSPERIKNVARRVAKWHRAGHQMVVVVSAMSGETNRLIALAKEIQPNPDPRELDVVASTGEQVSIGLLAMALKAIGVDAVSFNGSQVAVHTDSSFGKARIESIDSEAVMKELDAGKAVHGRGMGVAGLCIRLAARDRHSRRGYFTRVVLQQPVLELVLLALVAGLEQPQPGYLHVQAMR